MVRRCSRCLTRCRCAACATKSCCSTWRASSTTASIPVGACVIESISGGADVDGRRRSSVRRVRCARGSDSCRRGGAGRRTGGGRVAGRHARMSRRPVAGCRALNDGVSHLGQPFVVAWVAELYDGDSLDEVGAPIERASSSKRHRSGRDGSTVRAAATRHGPERSGEKCSPCPGRVRRMRARRWRRRSSRAPSSAADNCSRRLSLSADTGSNGSSPASASALSGHSRRLR